MRTRWPACWNKKGSGVCLYEAFLDVSRFGNAVCKLIGETIYLIPPRYWFPIFDPEDGRTVTAQVLAWPADRMRTVGIPRFWWKSIPPDK